MGFSSTHAGEPGGAWTGSVRRCPESNTAEGRESGGRAARGVQTRPGLGQAAKRRRCDRRRLSRSAGSASTSQFSGNVACGTGARKHQATCLQVEIVSLQRWRVRMFGDTWRITPGSKRPCF